MIIDKGLLEKQIKILALQLNKKLTTKERDAIEGILNLAGDISDALPMYDEKYVVDINVFAKTTPALYRVQLLPGHKAQKDQFLKDGENIYLASNDNELQVIWQYEKKEAKRKALRFGGKIEKI